MYFVQNDPQRTSDQSSCGHRSETETNETASPEWKVQICASSKSKVARHTGHIEEFRKY
jgi:hypothetical protein